MTKLRYFLIIKSLLKFGFGYAIFEFIIHFSNIRTLEASQYWPQDATVFAQLFMQLWAIVMIFGATIIFYLHQHIETSKTLAKYISIYCLFHALVLLYLSRINYESIIPYPSAFVWLPSYHWLLRFESLLMLIFPTFIAYGLRRNYLK